MFYLALKKNAYLQLEKKIPQLTVPLSSPQVTVPLLRKLQPSYDNAQTHTLQESTSAVSRQSLPLATKRR